MQTYIAKKDLGKKETYAQWNGKFLGDDSYDEYWRTIFIFIILIFILEIFFINFVLFR